ncbi:phage holin family protein [Desulfobotulus sp. H1]|uniref:Phage holin family protein n=1 Tax=Desulfobotulus pelophilus TaxID=2823377 RepID=A0ABT3N7Y9_9BACT|nr:phage holin family protein [Desulfobotulus pelophilus]MCW7753570.1 phage holin family protein [Desulfobotulus pelophilus]
MEHIAVRWLILTVSILVAGMLFQGIEIASVGTAIAAAAILGVLNAFIRPVLLLLTLPVTLLSLGLFAFVINAFLLQISAALVSGFEVSGFWTAFWASLVMAVINVALTGFRFENGRIIVVDTRRRGPWD